MMEQLEKFRMSLLRAGSGAILRGVTARVLLFTG